MEPNPLGMFGSDLRAAIEPPAPKAPGLAPPTSAHLGATLQAGVASTATDINFTQSQLDGTQHHFGLWRDRQVPVQAPADQGHVSA